MVAKPGPGPEEAVGPVAWGARINYDLWTDRWTPKDEIAIHYGGGANTAGSVTGVFVEQLADERAVLRGWEAFHIDGRGWRGIAYNFAIGQSGTIYRLRGWNNNGAHYSNDDVDYDGIPSNIEGVAVVFILGGDQVPTNEAIAAFERLRAYLESTMADSLPLYGHKEVAASGGHSTACPGTHLMAYIETHRESTSDTGTVIPGGGWPPTLRKGDLHAKVRVLRGMLFALGQLRSTNRLARFKFNANVDDAVRKFQEKHHLEVDGIVGAVTRSKLYRKINRTNKEAS